MKRVFLVDSFGVIDYNMIRRAAIAIAEYLCNGEEGYTVGSPIYDWTTENRQKDHDALFIKGIVKQPYSSCGDLVNAVLFCLGCRDESLVNRTNDNGVQPWQVSQNISKITGHKSFVSFTGQSLSDDGNWPFMGDPIVVCCPYHVAILESFDFEKGVSTTLDYGQWDQKRGAYGAKVKRSIRMEHNNCIITDSLHREKHLFGFIPLTSIDYHVSAIVPDTFEEGVLDISEPEPVNLYPPSKAALFNNTKRWKFSEISTMIVLSSQFLAPYYAKRDNFTGLLARVVYKGHYSRDGESWTDTIKRTVEGNVNELGANCTVSEAEQLFDVMWNGYALPPGRGLWTGGVPNMPTGARYNCWGCELRTIDDLCWTMTQLMLGGGVGVSLFKVDQMPVVSNAPCSIFFEMKQDHGDFDKFLDFMQKKENHPINEPSKNRDTQVIRIPDTREGWVDAYRQMLICAFVGKRVVFDFSDIRKHGVKLKTFGGISSGPVPLIELFVRSWNIIRSNKGKKLSSVNYLDLIDWIGVCVQSGNIRRSAIIVIGKHDDNDFRKAKQDREKVNQFRWASNNSHGFEHEDEFESFDWLKLIEDNRTFGDPGFVNFWLARKNDPNVVAINPCGEQMLHHREGCNLAELFPGNWSPSVNAKKTIELMMRYCIRQRLAPMTDSVSEAVRIKNMRVGLGMGGLCDFPWNEDILQEYYGYARNAGIEYANELNVNIPVTFTTVKPSGSISLLTNSNAGIHSPKGEYIIRRLRFNIGDPMIETLKAAGVPYAPDHYSPNGRVVFEFPLKSRLAPGQKTSMNETVTDQINRQLTVQKAWADNAVSITVEYNDDEVGILAKLLKDNIRRLKSCSFLHKEHEYEQSPIEVITKERFEELSKGIDQRFALDSEVTSEFETCDSGSCGIDRVAV